MLQDIYETFNIILRRKPKENNFKAVLETIRDLMNTECVIPDWLHNIILGYGDPAAAHYSKYCVVCSPLLFCGHCQWPLLITSCECGTVMH